jgi:hypothetical protein
MSVGGRIRGVDMRTNPRIGGCFAGAVIFLAVIALIVGMTGCGCEGYNPPPVQRLEIRTWYDLDAIRDDLDASYILMNDLDSTTPGYVELAGPTANQGKGWEPIGYGGYWGSPWFGPREGGPIFKGSFDGQGHEIRDLYISRGGLLGLFGFVSKGGIIVEGGIIKNIALINATVTVGESAADPVGLDQYSVKCLDVGTMEAYGGLVGYNGGTVSNCYATINVTGLWSVGGLVGYHDGTVSNCYAMGNVAGDSEVGGLVGWNAGTVKNSYSACSVSSKSSIGGLVGSGVDYHVDRSFWNTEISGQSTSAGGTGKTTAEMMDITTFSGAGWNITTVADSDTRNKPYIWNIVDGVTYPFLSWQSTT